MKFKKLVLSHRWLQSVIGLGDLAKAYVEAWTANVILIASLAKPI